jgi:hypothetical protein
MSIPRKPTTRPKQKPRGEYQVGFARPPERTQFKGGNQAASKKGRPQGRKNNRTIIEEIADFKVKIELPGRKFKRMSLWEAGIWKMAVKAVNCDLKAFQGFNGIMQD